MRAVRTPIAAAVLALAASGQTTTRLSSRILETTPSVGALSQRISPDGRFVVFQSASPVLVAGDTNGAIDAFVLDRATQSVERVSVSSAGAQGPWGGYTPSISDDGRFAAFASSSPDLVAGDTNGAHDVFVRDRIAGTTERVSLRSSGAQTSGPSAQPAISGDGACVVFRCADAQIDPSHPGVMGAQVYLRDRNAATSECVSLTGAGVVSNDISTEPAVSFDGRFVAFTSYGTNFVAGDAVESAGGNGEDVFVRDRLLGLTHLVSAAQSGGLSNAASTQPSISAGGRFVAFTSWANDLAPGDTGFDADVFVRDLVAGVTTCVSVTPSGFTGGDASLLPALSADGRHVVFESRALDLLASPLVPGNVQIFRRDLALGTTQLVSVSSCGVPANGWSVGSSRDSLAPALSGDGQLATFISYAHSLTAGDLDHAASLFLRDFGQPITPWSCSFCAPSTTSNGCQPTLTSSGAPSAAQSSGFTLHVAQVEGQRIGIGVFNTSPYYALPFVGGSTSRRCVLLGGRLPTQSSGGTHGACDGAFAWDWLQYRANNAGVAALFPAGAPVFVQGWFRDAAAPGGSNMSDALQFVMAP